MMNTEGDAILVGGASIHVIQSSSEHLSLCAAVQRTHHSMPFTLALLEGPEWVLTNIEERMYIFKYLKETRYESSKARRYTRKDPQ